MVPLRIKQCVRCVSTWFEHTVTAVTDTRALAKALATGLIRLAAKKRNMALGVPFTSGEREA